MTAPSTLTGIAACLDAFIPVSLETLNSRAMLLNRIDCKYVFPLYSLEAMLHQCQKDYAVLEVNGARISGYQTRYYDTDELRSYFDHHRGRGNRFKVRRRIYEASGQAFLEVKFRTNKSRTDKQRLPIDANEPAFYSEEGKQFIHRLTGLDTRSLKETMMVCYQRVTLLHKTNPEKVTFDLCPDFRNEKGTRNFQQLVIAEAKTERGGRMQFSEFMHRSQTPEGSLSKYCLGMIALDEALKHNHFKPLYRHINHINQHGSH